MAGENITVSHGVFRINVGNIKLSQLLMTVAWVMYLFVLFFTQQSGFALKYNLRGAYYATLMISSVLVLVKVFVCDRVPLKKLAIIAVAIAVLMVSGVRSGDYSIVMIGVFALGMRGIDFKELLKVDIICKCVIIVSIVFLSLVGVLENYVAVVDGHEKYSYGFYHPNMFGALLGAIVIEYLYLRFSRFSYADYAFFIAALGISFFVSRTRSMVLLLSVILLFFILIRYFDILNIRNPAVKYLLMFTPVVCLLFTVVVMLYYRTESPAWYALNKAMSGRLYYASYYWQQYGPSLLGQQIELVSSRAAGHRQSLILDNCYAKLVIMFGVVPTVILLGALMRQIRNAVEMKDYQLLVIVLYFCLLGLFENYFIRPAYNITLLLLLYYDNPHAKHRFRFKWK